MQNHSKELCSLLSRVNTIDLVGHIHSLHAVNFCHIILLKIPSFQNRRAKTELKRLQLK